MSRTNGSTRPGPAIGRAIKALREQRGLSLQEAATGMGLSAKSYLHKLEQGGVPNPSIATVLAAAQLLGVTVGVLLAEPPSSLVTTAERELELRRALQRVGREALRAAGERA